MERLQQRIESYNFFAFIFLTLPDDAFIENVLALDIPHGAEGGMKMLKTFIDASKNKDKKELWTELSVDRTYLIRALSQDGPRPPYESVYCGGAAHETVAKLNIAYSKLGYAVSEGAHEPSDYIGIEMGFMKELCQRELAADNAEIAQEMHGMQKVFFHEHLGRWGAELGNEFVMLAKTDFYKAVGQILKDFIEEEQALFA